MRAAVITEEIHVALLQQGTNIALAVDYIGQTEHTAWSLLWRHYWSNLSIRRSLQT